MPHHNLEIWPQWVATFYKEPAVLTFVIPHLSVTKERLEPYSSNSLRECYEQGAKAFNWSRRHFEPRSLREKDWWVGYGMTSATYPVNIFPASARVDLRPDGTAKVVSATQDIGTGSDTVMAQVAAEHLALDLNKVRFDLGDSDYPKASVSGGSSTMASVGSAVKIACDQVKSQLIEAAITDQVSPLHGAHVDEIGFAQDRLFIKADPKRTEDYFALMRRKNLPIISATGETQGKDADAKKFAAHSFGAQFAEVRVHALTGEVRVQKYVGAFACGQIINSMMAKSQFMGGIIFGLGMALMEESIADQRSGKMVIKDLADYHVPVQSDVPEIEVIMVAEKDSHINPIGAKGIGEIGVVGAAAAVANAVFNATGLRIRDLPLTPDKISMAHQSGHRS